MENNLTNGANLFRILVYQRGFSICFNVSKHTLTATKLVITVRRSNKNVVTLQFLRCIIALILRCISNSYSLYTLMKKESISYKPRNSRRKRSRGSRILTLLGRCLRVVVFVIVTVFKALYEIIYNAASRRPRIALSLAGGCATVLIGFMLLPGAPSSEAEGQGVARINYRTVDNTASTDENTDDDTYTASDADTTDRWQRCLPDMPEPCIGMKIKRFTVSYGNMFNDSNYVHWADARKIGIEPMSDTRSHWQLRRPLVKMTSCEHFYIENLRFSRPYLVPEAAEMLHEIGRRFRDTLEARGGGDYRIKVTSLLRTPSGVARLRRRNVNAVDSSVHQLGTTVDISYSRFVADSDRMPRSQADLKAVLAEVLEAMRNEGKCWVKHERNQPCFHITARPKGSTPPDK